MNRALLLLIGFLWGASSLWAQRILSEATLRYSVQLQDESDSASQNLLKGAVHTCYIKGPNSRLDLETPLGKQSTILQGKTGTVVLLKEYGLQHYLINLTPAQWEEVNARYNNSTLELISDTTTILGYPCQRAKITTQDGTTYAIWYTRSIMPAYREFQQMGKTLPGLMMEYETMLGSLKVRYRINQLLTNPVPQAKFDIPTSGYRVLTYEESKSLGGN
jgi:hypothetical protein